MEIIGIDVSSRLQTTLTWREIRLQSRVHFFKNTGTSPVSSRVHP